MKTESEMSLSMFIKKKAGELGFNLVGISRSRTLTESSPFLEEWCKKGMNDKMSYLARDIEKRLNPASIYETTKSVVVTGISYYSGIGQTDPRAPVISRYAYGADYHHVISEKLGMLLEHAKRFNTATEGRIVVDSSPLLEKAWAREAGLGWQGKNSIIINKRAGSFFFIGVLLLNTELEYDKPLVDDYCGHCRSCIEACPTGAINDNRTVDARKCIANLTIENRDPVPENIASKFGRRIYGCDRCQEVCPWNANAVPDLTPEFTLDSRVASMTLEDWKNLSRERFSQLFDMTVMKRVGYDKLMKNIEAVIRE
jgi:epoxyqueuosine reductase